MVKQTTTKKTKPVGKGKVQCHVKEKKKCKTQTKSSGHFVALELWVFLWNLQWGKKPKKILTQGTSG